MTASPRRPATAWLLLGVGGWLGAHRFYLGSYLGGAAQAALMLFGLFGPRGAALALTVLLAWLLFDILWVYRRTRPPAKARDGHGAHGAHGTHGARPAANPENKAYDLAALAEANKLQAQFVAAAEAHDWARAVPIAEQIVAGARRIFKGPHPNLAMSLCMLGQACHRLKAFDKAQAHLEESLAIGRQTGLPAEDMDVARKALALTRAAIGERRARGATTDSEAALLNLLEEKETRYRDALAQGDLPRAERLCAEAVATSRQLCGGPGKSVVFHLSSHAELCRRMQWHDKAEVAANEALAMATQLGLDDSWLRGPTNTLALLHAAAGRADEAEALYKKTIAMAVAEARGGSSDGVVRAFNNLAFLYAESGQNDKAELCYARALVHLDKLRDSEGALERDAAAGAEGDAAGDAELHSHMLNNFASLKMARRDFDGARPLYERSLAIQQRSCRGISTAAANAHNDLGLMAQEDGDLRQALTHFQRTLLLNQICTPDHFGNIENAQRSIDSVSMVLAAVAHAARMEPST